MARQLASHERRFLLYALGSGRGHATRMGALALELGRLGAEVRLLVSAGAQGITRALGLDPSVVWEAREAPERAWSLALRSVAPTDCVVDTFPEGLHRELDPKEHPPARWIALLRCRRDARSPAFLTSLSRYADVLDLEPALAWAPLTARPFGSVVRSIERGMGQPAVDVLAVATEARQRAFLENLAARLARSGIRTACVPAHGAGRSDAPLLSGDAYSARVVVGPAGYNLTYELSALGVWHLALPAARQYDDQERRAERVAVVAHSPDAVERRVRAWLDQAVTRPRGELRTMPELAAAVYG